MFDGPHPSDIDPPDTDPKERLARLRLARSPRIGHTEGNASSLRPERRHSSQAPSRKRR